MVTPEAYAAEIAKVHEERPGIRVVVYDHTFHGNRGVISLRLQMDGYQNERGAKPLGSTWKDTPQEHWTSPAQEPVRDMALVTPRLSDVR
jgi:hypothetical protein